MKLETQELAIIGAGVVLLLMAAANARNLAKKTVKVAEDVFVGTVEGVGEVFGVPTTDKTKCQKDIEAGDWWAASFSCPAGDFLGAGWGEVFGNDAGGSGASGS